MAKAVITLTDRQDRDGIDFSMEILPPPNPSQPPTPVEAVAFDIVERLRRMEGDGVDDEPTDIDDPTDMWETTDDAE